MHAIKFKPKLARWQQFEATSQLQLGAKGVFEGEPFELTGRRCVQGARGQIWNEWTMIVLIVLLSLEWFLRKFNGLS